MPENPATTAGCPNAEQHEAGPVGYAHWHDWATAKSALYQQKRCPGCGLWIIWKRRDHA